MFLKKAYIFLSLFSNIIISNFLFSNIENFFKFLKSKQKVSENVLLETSSNFNLFIGCEKRTSKNVFLPESGLFQNFLITGTIGSGKTSCAMYPFTEQFLEYNSKAKIEEKFSILILDVKGNYHKYVSSLCQKYFLQDDLVVIDLTSKVKYNPLHKPNLKPQVLANQLKTILTLFSEKNSDSFWLDKAEQVLTECIKLCRLYNNNYVTFLELHKLIFFPNYYQEKIQVLRNNFISGKYSQEEIYNLNSSLDFFEKEFNFLDQRTLAILKSEISRITNTFISDFEILQTFCSKEEELTFSGFSEVLSSGKIVVLNLNIAEYKNLSQIIATYLKLDFQTEIMANLSNDNIFKSVFLCDEYDKYCTKTDGEFFSLSREAKCINIVSTQSYSSLKNALKDDCATKVILQNLINKIWFRTDDIFTIDEAKKQIGKEEKEKISKSVSESAKETTFSYITNSLNSESSNISESFSVYSQYDYIYDSNFFSQNLETFSCLTFLSNGFSILPPSKLVMTPYFKKASR